VSTLPVTGGTGGTMSASALLVLALGAVLVIAARRNTAA
jgi:LPXTG-motif cell wall-anchored protein